jgi:hypothetical protein
MKRDIYGHANSTCSLFVQALLGEKSNGRLYENIAFTLHLRDKDNKASRTKAFYLDKQIANVWGCDLAHPGCNRVFESRKQVKGQYRSLLLTPAQTPKGAYRLSILNDAGDKDKTLFITLSQDERRALGMSIVRVIRYYEERLNEAAWMYD